MILARTLRRTFLLRGDLPEDCFAFLHADPLLPAPTERTEVIEVEPRPDGFFSMRCSWGRSLTGSGRSLAHALDMAMYRLAYSDEEATPSMNASVVRCEEARMLLVAEVGVDLSELTVALLMSGAAFEGTGRVFIRAGGVVAHPIKPRVKSYRLASLGLSCSQRELPTLYVEQDWAYCAFDPKMTGVEWSVIEGAVPLIVIVEPNDGGRSAITRLRFDTALTCVMQSLRSRQRLDARAFVRFRAMVESAGTFRLSMGDPLSAAALVWAQLPLALADERDRLPRDGSPSKLAEGAA